MALEAAGAEGSAGISMQVIDAGEILEKVQKGQPVEYDHVVVRGDLDLSRDNLQKNITSPIRINDSIFKGFVSLYVFSSHLSFRKIPQNSLRDQKN